MTNDNIFLDTSVVLTKIDVKDLLVGMYVSKLDRPWLETSFLFQGFELKSAGDVKEVQRQCEYVFIDEQKQNKSLKITARNTGYTKSWLDQGLPPERKSDFRQEFEAAESTHQISSRLVKSFMEEVALGRPINVEMAKKAVSQCVQSIIKSPDALMWLTQLKNADEYTSQHSMNVCIFAIAIANQINLPVEELEKVGLCGMMHDMGKMKIPKGVLNKPGSLEPDELAIMQTHPAKGWQLLMSSAGMPGCAIDAAYGHHERLDGKGYPRGLTAEGIHPYTRMVTIADIYDAITSDRVYKKGKTHLEAISIMTKAYGTQLDEGLVIKFIESLGVYPPGSLVEMTNGEVAVVIETNPLKKLKPKITMLLDEDKKRVKPRLVDLAKMDLDASGKNYGVRRIIRFDEYDLDLNMLYKMGIVQDSLAAA